MNIIIRADASPTMGTGHVMRCLALAQWARKMCIPCTLVGRFHVAWIKERLAKETIECVPLQGKIPQEEKPEELLQSLGAPPQDSWVVLDGYHFTLACQKAVRTAGYKLLVIDDYAHLPEYSCDILLNQNIGAEQLVYHGDIRKKCLGLEYVLLRQEFIEAREKAKSRTYPHTPYNMLLTLGGGDFSLHLSHIAQYFSLSEMQNKNLRIIAGSMQEKDIYAALSACPAEIEILYNVSNMPALLLDTDLCISAGGSTCWELCCLGVPFLTVEVAKNQREIIAHFEKIHIAYCLSKHSLQKSLSTHGYDILKSSLRQNRKLRAIGIKNIFTMITQNT